MQKIKNLLVFVVLILLFVITGCAKNPNITNKISGPSDSSLEVYFPRDGQDPAPVLKKLYDGSKKEIDVAIYGLTHPQIVKALTDAQKRGVKVRVITDAEESKSNVQKHAINDLLLAGVPVAINSHSGLQHLKLSVIDGEVATTGSYNYTRSASDRNDEMLVVSRDQAFIKKCQYEFERMWADNKNFTLIK